MAPAAGSKEENLHDVMLEIISAALNFITPLPFLTCWAALDKACNMPRPLFTH